MSLLPFVCQNFWSVLDKLTPALSELKRYDKFIFLYSEFTFHPKKSIFIMWQVEFLIKKSNFVALLIFI